MLRRSLLPLALLALAATACDSYKQAPQSGSITHHLMMVDSEGKNYGVVELDPINGGKVFDSQGRLIGRVVPPGTAGVAPTVQ